MLSDKRMIIDFVSEKDKVAYKDAQESLEFLLPISDSYPNIEKWFQNIVVPGLGDGTRKLFIQRSAGVIIALGIAKRTETEKKICTVRVAPSYVGKGIGVRIFKEAMQWLGTDMPHLTVSEDRLPDFERIFRHFNYKLTSTSKGKYLPGKVEYLYNEKKRLK